MLFALLVMSSSCEKKEITITTNLDKARIDLKEMQGVWLLNSTKIGFPYDTPKVKVTTNEKYKFSTDNQTYKRYIDDILLEEGTFKLSINDKSKSSVTFSKDESSATIFFEDGELVIGTRVRKGENLIDYDNYQYYNLTKSNID